MTGQHSKADIYMDHELVVAERYRWWGVYLIREKRRLQAIASAIACTEVVQAGEADAGPGGETPDELLTRLDAALEEMDAISEVGESQRQRRTGVLLGRPKDSRGIEED